MAGQLRHGTELVELLDHAGALLEAQGSAVDHGRDRDLGLGLGW